MTALVRLNAATFLHSQRYLPPVLLYVAVVGVFSANDDGPLAPVHGSCSAALFVCAAWLTIALISTDDPAHRAIVVVSAGRSGRVLISMITVVLLACLGLTVVGLIVPLLLGDHVVTPLALVLGLLAFTAAATTGTAVGLVCSRHVIRRPGYALVAALGLVLLLLFVPGLPPVNLMLQTMGTAVTPDGPIPVVLGCLIAGLVLLAASGAVARYVASRRD